MRHLLLLLFLLGSAYAAEKPFTLLTDELFAKLPEAQRTEWAANIAAMQVRIDGQPTVWCAQHHPLTLEPVKARAKEPPSLSGGESANLVKFLMRSGPTTPEVVAMIESALKWFDTHRLHRRALGPLLRPPNR